jgi:photosystem II stability/assembly factor-like uncharacterized protein
MRPQRLVLAAILAAAPSIHAQADVPKEAVKGSPPAAASEATVEAPAASTPGTTPESPVSPAPADASPSAGIPIASSLFGDLEPRAIGPALMSGRISALDAVPGNPPILYVGAASGGVWKSSDGGLSFKPIFDKHIQSIGSIRVDPGQPQTIWVGTGESWVRNSVSIGDGLYKSTDGGESWHHQGFAASERIADVLVHPAKSDTVWVCSLGPLWSSGGERGVYKSTDGGKSWKHVLFVDEDTGCADMDLDPQMPDILYAGMWQFRRTAWSFSSGGPGSGLYKSTDGGETWKRITRGLPEGDLGRIAVAVSPARPSVVYANVESKETAFYRSDDLGESWTRLNSSFNITARPFYFSLVVPDPLDYNTVYKPGLTLAVSTDGGQSFTSPFSGGFGNVHVDHHALWINPADTKHMVLGTDGGLYISFDRGVRWLHVRSLPLSQFYRVSADLDVPYNVYGGLQDNGSWMGPSRHGSRGIANSRWRNVGYGDGFCTFRDPSEPDIVYSEYQGGKLSRMRLRTGESKDIQPFPGPGEPKYRFNWNTPFLAAPDGSDTLYVGAQFLFRSRDRGDTWERISPDLTTNDPEKQRQQESGGLNVDDSSAENHCTIYSIGPSAIAPNVIWVGTDDGNVQVTRDGGKSWTNVSRNLPGLPPGTGVSTVEPGRHDPAVAYVTFDGHTHGDMSTYVYKTTSFGQTWQPLMTKDLESFAHVVREDLVRPGLLFLGTETGLFVSLDDGRHWARFGERFPHVPVRDIVIHPREHDVVVATHGRGIFIVDDITPLRHLTAEVIAAEATLLPTRPAQMTIPSSEFEVGSDAELVGTGPMDAAPIVYYFKKRHIFGDLKLEVYDAEGKLVRTLPAGKRAGINRVPWPMRLEPPKVPAANAITGGAFVGPRVAEGKYRIRLVKGKDTAEGEVQLVADARSLHTAEDRALQQKTAMQLYAMLGELTFLADSVVHLRDQSRARAQGLPEDDKLGEQLSDHADELEALRTMLVATSPGGWISSEQQIREKLSEVYGGVAGYEGRPTTSQLERTAALVLELASAQTAFEALAGQLAELNGALRERGLDPLKLLSREEWQKRQGS